MNLILKIYVLFLFTFQVMADQRLFIDHPETLQNWQNQGFSLPALLSDLSKEKMGKEIHNNWEFYNKNSFYQSIVEDLSHTLMLLQQRDPKLSTGMKTIHRLFNKEWLRSKEHRYDFVGVVFRPDRKAFLANSCGELRFIYRLSYEKEKKDRIYSRLPMTFNLVYSLRQVEACCASQVALWDSWKLSPKKDTLDPFFKAASFKSLEVNLQSVRWPSTIRPDMGGYAEYLLRVYKSEKGQALLSPLENTPDLVRLSKDISLKKEFKNWLIKPENLALIDQGHPLIPEKFLAKEATSVALVGVHRLNNAPYSELFKEADFNMINFSKYSRVKSPHGLIKRLNDLTCMGCHQGRTVAGFHFLGRDLEKTNATNSIHVAASAHFLGDQERRIKYVQNLIADKVISPSIPFSVRGDHEAGKIGAHCGLGDSSFSDWTCETGLFCMDLYQDKLVSRTGVCQPHQKIAGAACQVGKIKHATDSHRDRVVTIKEESCGEGSVCEDLSVGFPAGMCTKPCQKLSDKENCGSIAILQGFNSCLIAGKKAFYECLENNVRPSALMSCDETQFCRDDYICAKTKEGAGVCIPPYFLFQLRVDGH